ncbi:CapA family protein [uncultured Ezakiella sp.]|uniref:CapA family protein n=1 Tax=uncultured Ezakiella sp. TaxID=1637529 RepID=UPI0025FDC1AD|nr:CapA family protein [uncultured Ezakiella sp.]
MKRQFKLILLLILALVFVSCKPGGDKGKTAEDLTTSDRADASKGPDTGDHADASENSSATEEENFSDKSEKSDANGNSNENTSSKKEENAILNANSDKIENEIKKSLSNEDYQATLMVAGDIMFHSPQLDAAKEADGTYSFMNTFRYLRPLLSKGYAIANFETTIADGNFSGYPAFRTPHNALNAIKFVGFDMVALANNHSLDGGMPGIIRTIETADFYQLAHLGTYKDENTEPLIVNIEGRDIAFLNYTYGLNGLDRYIEGKEYMVNTLDKDKILRDIAYAKENAQGTIVIVHWGTEYRRTADPYQEEWARFFAENGVDIILGSHPHVIEPAVFIDHEGFKTYCIYSMGNFLSNQRREYMGGSPYGEDGVIVELQIKADGDRVYADTVTYHPTWVHRINKPLSFTIYPCEAGLNGEIDGVDDFIRGRLQESYDRTMDILKDTNADS